ncbi:MAG: hypothetical protein U5J64_07945 [Halobacteriales archaeon]|nr:hypothetical protein [Halobacteriales archaeon]
MDDDELNRYTFESEGYQKKDWLPLLSKFDEHDKLTPHHDVNAEVGELLFHPDNNTGEQIIYYMEDGGPGGFHLEYSPRRRTEEGQMLWGTVEFQTAEFKEEILKDPYRDIFEEHATDYMEPTDNILSLAEIEVPENYDEKTWEETIEASVQMIEDSRRLQNSIKDAIEEFEP